MKIVIDAGVIGLAQLFETARTGVYRVVSNLTLELLKRENLDISYSTLSTIQVNQLTVKYLENRGFSGRNFPVDRLEEIVLGFGEVNLDTPQNNLAAKVLSRLCRIFRARRIGREADLYHSLYLPLPQFKGTDGPVKMLTVYDIIPLIHPEYFDKSFVDDFKSIMASFSPEKDFLFAISESTKSDLCAWFDMEPERIFVTPLAAATELYYPVEDKEKIATVKTKLSIPNGRYFLTLATLEKRKNLRMSIDCFKKVACEEGNEDLYFVLVGTLGWKVKELMEEIANDPFLQRRLVFTGFVADEYLSALYSGAEAFLYPSLYEGFGLPPLEAMQCGLPVITSNTSSLPEVVGNAGLLVDPTDKDGMCDAMLTLLNDSTLHRELREKGIERAAQFSWSHCADATIAGYTQAWSQR